MNYIKSAEEKLRLVYCLKCFQSALREEMSKVLVDMGLTKEYKDKIKQYYAKLGV